MKRIYEKIIEDHFASYDEALFLSGPRQVGKTTIAEHIRKKKKRSIYLNWDNLDDREKILSRDLPFLEAAELEKPLLIFDEIHKYKEWKTYLKGLFDHHKKDVNFLVTGSSRLNIYRRGGDSMMGRYFLYRIHPLSVAELCGREDFKKETSDPKSISKQKWDALLQYGGFPKPFLAQDMKLYNRWKNQRLERFFEEDIRDVLNVHDVDKMQVLAKILQELAGCQVNYTNLSKLIQSSDQTVRAWLSHLESFYYCFTLKPWSRNIVRSLIKEPKLYLWDWSIVKDKGQRYENFVASHLLKAVHFWTDDGLGQFELYYVRDKDKREVDFLITKDDKPFMMVEVKSSSKEPLSENLLYFQDQMKAEYVFQVVIEADYIDKNCFRKSKKPLIVPAKTFLSQLV